MRWLGAGFLWGWAIYFACISNDSVALWRRWKFDGAAVFASSTLSPQEPPAASLSGFLAGCWAGFSCRWGKGLTEPKLDHRAKQLVNNTRSHALSHTDTHAHFSNSVHDMSGHRDTNQKHEMGREAEIKFYGSAAAFFFTKSTLKWHWESFRMTMVSLQIHNLQQRAR